MGIVVFFISALLYAKDDTQNCLTQLLRNVSPAGAAKGAVVASPSKVRPNYYRHWIRDAALVQRELVFKYIHSKSPSNKKFYLEKLEEFRQFSLINQKTANLSSGLGEPFFQVDGSPSSEQWGRPQNDGPALRAVTFILLAEALLAEGKEGLVKGKFYSAGDSLIKNDLDYVSRHWEDHCFDLWEEVDGKHYFTLLSHWDAMARGSRLAKKLGDAGASEWYLSQSKLIEKFVERHWDAKAKVFWPTWDRVGGVSYKDSGIDVGSLIAILTTQGTLVSYADERVLHYVNKIEKVFRDLYPINNGAEVPLIGRYPEDKYDGYETGKVAHPWFITTNAVGEYYFRLAASLVSQKQISITPLNREFFENFFHVKEGDLFVEGSDRFEKIINALRSKGLNYYKRILFFQSPQGNMSEQIDRIKGDQTGAVDLTWSYASLLSFLRAMRGE